MSNEIDLSEIFGKLKVLNNSIAKSVENNEKEKTFCMFDLLRDEIIFTIFEFLTAEVVSLTECSKKFRASVLFYGEILKRHFQDDLSVTLPIFLPKFLKSNQPLFHLKKHILRIQHQEWSVLNLYGNVNGNKLSRLETGNFRKYIPLYFRHRNYRMEFTDFDSIQYDFQYQFIKLPNGYYKIMNPYRNGYCIRSDYMIVPNRNDDLDDISWVIEPKEDNLIALKSVKTGKYISAALPHNGILYFNSSTYKPFESQNSDCYALFEIVNHRNFSTIPEVFKDHFSGYSKVSWESEINSLLIENAHHFQMDNISLLIQNSYHSQLQVLDPFSSDDEDEVYY